MRRGFRESGWMVGRSAFTRSCIAYAWSPTTVTSSIDVGTSRCSNIPRQTCHVDTPMSAPRPSDEPPGASSSCYRETNEAEKERIMNDILDIKVAFVCLPAGHSCSSCRPAGACGRQVYRSDNEKLSFSTLACAAVRYQASVTMCYDVVRKRCCDIRTSQ